MGRTPGFFTRYINIFSLKSTLGGKYIVRNVRFLELTYDPWKHAIQVHKSHCLTYLGHFYLEKLILNDSHRTPYSLSSPFFQGTPSLIRISWRQCQCLKHPPPPITRHCGGFGSELPNVTMLPQPRATTPITPTTILYSIFSSNKPTFFPLQL